MVIEVINASDEQKERTKISLTLGHIWMHKQNLYTDGKPISS